MESHRNGNGPRIVLIGGGSGSSMALRGLKAYTSNLTAIVTMFDSGGSSGLLRKEFGYPALGDLRQCLVALADEDEPNDALRTLVNFRFQRDSSLKGHSLGNLLLAALTTLHSDVEHAIDEMARILNIHGKVVPVTLEQADLCAELDDGTVVNGESNIDLRGARLPRIRRVFLKPPTKANARAIQAIREAEAVVLGPGDLYTSIIPNLLVDGIAQAIQETRATRIYVCNLMTKLGETDEFKASDFVKTMLSYLKGASLDWAVVNTKGISKEIRQLYITEGASFVAPDIEELQKYIGGVFGIALANNQQPVRHDPTRLAEAIMSIISQSACIRPANAHNNGNGSKNGTPKTSRVVPRS